MSAKIYRIVCLGLVTLLLSAVFIPIGFTQQTIKIGCVDLFEVFDKTQKFQKVKEELRQIAEEKKIKLQQMTKAWMDERDKFIVQQELLPEETARERHQELLQEQQQIMEMEKSEQQEFNEIKNEKLDPLMEEIVTVIETIANEEGYAFIFHKRRLLFANPQYDLTAKVIERIDETK